jgi:tetraprenyl-beta-curcumene synthase
VDHQKLGPALAGRWLTTRAGLALTLANARYWPTVAPVVHAELDRWKRQAEAIPEKALKTLALQKLRDERFNAEVAATLATLAPRLHRAPAVEAIVALEVMYDYLDGLTEQPAHDPLSNARQLFRAFTEAVTPRTTSDTDYYRYHPSSEDGGYLEALANTVKLAIARLPAAAAVAETARVSAELCAEAQTRVHAAAHLGAAQLEDWAEREARSTPLRWRAFTAGAVASVLALHALIAAAADQRTTPEQTRALDAAYFSISALSTMLDSLIDYEEDVRTGGSWLLLHYANPTDLQCELVEVTRYAIGQVRALPHAPHHVMTLVGVVAYYTSAPAASALLAQPPVARIQRELQPLITPTLAVMRAWRTAKRTVRHR